MSDPTRLTASALQQRLEDPAPPVVIDVLPADEHAAYHPAGAVNACVYEVVFLDRVAELVPAVDTPIVVVGAGGASLDADLAADKLHRAGYPHVAVLEGGRVGWHAAGLPSGGDQPAPGKTPAPLANLDGHWAVQPGQSTLRWEGRNPNGGHDGAVTIKGGLLTVAGGQADGRVDIDPATIVNHDLAGHPSQSALIAHLLSDDFLHVARHPEVAFAVNGIAALPEATLTTPTHRIEGVLGLRGVSAPLTIDATVSAIGGGLIAAEAHFDLDRTRWGMIYGSARFFAHLGKHVVFDRVSIALRLVLAPA